MTPTLALESILIFSVGCNHFCAAMRQINSVLDYQPLSKLPNTPPYVAGGFWYHGDFTQVINVRKKFALPGQDKPKSGSFITTHIDSELLAFWVDRIEDVADASKYGWQKLPALNTGIFSRALFRNQKIVLEVDFEKLKNTDSLNVTDLAKTLALCDPTTKQSNKTKTITAQTSSRTHSTSQPISHAIDNPTTGSKKKLIAGTTTDTTPSKTTPTPASIPKIINKQTIENNNAEETIPAKKENIFTKTNNTRDIGKLAQIACKRTTVSEHDDSSLNIAPILLLVSVVSVLLIFTFGTYLEKNLQKIFSPPHTEALIKTPTKKNTHDKLKKQNKAIAIKTQDHQIVIQRQQRNKILTTPSATQKNLGNKSGNNILFIHTVVEGDTLWHIAKRYRDNPYLYPELANLSKIRDPNLIYPGDTVTIKKRQ